MKHEELEVFKNLGLIKDYSLETIMSNRGKNSKEKLTLTFPNNQILSIESWSTWSEYPSDSGFDILLEKNNEKSI